MSVLGASTVSGDEVSPDAALPHLLPTCEPILVYEPLSSPKKSVD